jgi:hypothetical protein
MKEKAATEQGSDTTTTDQQTKKLSIVLNSPRAIRKVTHHGRRKDRESLKACGTARKKQISGFASSCER